MTRIAQLIVGGYVLAASTSAGAAIPDPVRIDSGLVSGTPGTSADVRVFKGLPGEKVSAGSDPDPARLAFYDAVVK